MKFTIGVMGSSEVATQKVGEISRTIGGLIAKKGAVLITGATTGLPLSAAAGAKQNGGEVIGFSPAINLEEHHRFGMPHDHHDLIICTGLSFKGRNLLNVRASHGIIFIGGTVGVLNEFTIAYDEEKIIGILEGSGGFCNHFHEMMGWLRKSNNRATLHSSEDPELLVESVYNSILQSYGG